MPEMSILVSRASPGVEAKGEVAGNDKRCDEDETGLKGATTEVFTVEWS